MFQNIYNTIKKIHRYATIGIILVDTIRYFADQMKKKGLAKEEIEVEENTDEKEIEEQEEVNGNKSDV